MWEHVVKYWFLYIYVAGSFVCAGAIIIGSIVDRVRKKPLAWNDLPWDDNWKRAERNFDTPPEPSPDEIYFEDARQRQILLEANNLDNYLNKEGENDSLQQQD
jgi:hypothetical protein